MTGENFLAFVLGMLVGYSLIYLGIKTKEYIYNSHKKKMDKIREDLVFDGVDDYVKCGKKRLKDYTVIKGDSWSAGKGNSHIIILENKENEKRDE